MSEPGEPKNEQVPPTDPEIPVLSQEEIDAQIERNRLEKEYNDLLKLPKRDKDQQERFVKLYEKIFGVKYKKK